MRTIFYLIWFFSIAVALPTVCNARQPSVDVVAEHGEDLNSNVPFIMRHRFSSESGVEWAEADYDQRKAFLEQWHAELADEAKQAKKEARAESREQREKDREKRQEQMENRWAERQEERDQRQAERDRRAAKRHFEDKVEEREDQLKELRRGEHGVEVNCRDGECS